MQELQKTWIWSLGLKKVPWRRKWQPAPVCLPGEPHGQRILSGCRPWGHQRVRHDLRTKQQQITILNHRGSLQPDSSKGLPPAYTEVLICRYADLFSGFRFIFLTWFKAPFSRSLFPRVRAYIGNAPPTADNIPLAICSTGSFSTRKSQFMTHLLE